MVVVMMCVAWRWRGSGANDSEDGVIVGFCAAAGEDNFLRARAEKGGDLFASGFDGGAGALADGVDGGGVAKLRGEIGKHRVEHGRFDGGGGVVIEIDAVHGSGIFRIARNAARRNGCRGKERPPTPLLFS